MLFRIFLLSLSLIAPALHAQEVARPEQPVPSATTPEAAPDAMPLSPEALLSIGIPQSDAERDEMIERSRLLQEESRLRKEAAIKAQSEASPICWKKFLVSACLDDARVAYRKEVILAKRQEREAQALERNVRKYDAAQKAKQRDADNAKRDAENERKAAEYRAKQAAKEKERAAQH